MSEYIVVNFDKKQYLRPALFGERADRETVVNSFQGVLTALVVLLSDSNGRGGGDLSSQHPCIGSWAGDRIAIIDDAVTDAGLSEPGMEGVPLQQQVLSLGKDVSQDALDAINQGEKDYWIPGNLNPRHCIALTEQRYLPGNAGQKLLNASGRAEPLLRAEEVFNVLGVDYGLTPASRRRQLEAGLLKMAGLLGRPERYSVKSVHLKEGNKTLPQPYQPRETMTVRGVTRLKAELVETADGSEHSLEVCLGEKGTTTEELYEKLFPGLVHERLPAITDGVKSPEVLKLLSMISSLEG